MRYSTYLRILAVQNGGTSSSHDHLGSMLLSGNGDKDRGAGHKKDEACHEHGAAKDEQVLLDLGKFEL